MHLIMGEILLGLSIYQYLYFHFSTVVLEWLCFCYGKGLGMTFHETWLVILSIYCVDMNDIDIRVVTWTGFCETL